MKRKLLCILSVFCFVLLPIAGCNQIVVVTQPQVITLPGQTAIVTQTVNVPGPELTSTQTITVPGQTSIVSQTVTFTQTVTAQTVTATVTATKTIAPASRVVLAEMFTGDW